ncbi:MBL fold metallo-hydrolase RNA specificity domain-containing protein [Marinobacter sp. LV10MA510-1]|uniref:MBL fold metallo-hydrolase RNA specificity domain-containing protein n=1 Tax=Marinobacter sp. LV10MA510-1 TaxID=1415567 RepID=UPI000BF6E300|nr:MBL fold metallo-hydrolase [Marinobacter sp. LV10MA510-1]PFG09481.1 metallo-beta-lactamase family protein [Marinobacter sp. LV10MA510-1]
MKLRFLGGAGTVTGSRYLVSDEQHRLLVDCGLYQGVKILRLRNRARFPVEPGSIEAVVLTHTHIDHSGYLPALVKNGFHGKIYCIRATHELCKVLLPDAGFLQEEDARYAARKKFSKHANPEPLFTVKDAQQALKHFESLDYHQPFEPVPGFSVNFTPAGHILGSACVHIHHENSNRTVVFSGDVGRQNDIIMRPPEPLSNADVLVCESTYGDRTHGTSDPETELAEIISATAARGGLTLIPSFAVGRAQMLLYIIHKLIAEKRIPDLPVFLNSPMAIKATEIFCHFHKEHRLNPAQCRGIDEHTVYVRKVEDSIKLDAVRYPCIIISASGMASGGRVLHHLKTLLPNHRNSVVFAGFQALGTRGDSLVNGASDVKIHGEYWPVKAQIHNLTSLSAHGDYNEILQWLQQDPALKPDKVYVTHGEPLASDQMRRRLHETLGWDAEVPELGAEVDI